jgi:DNA-binding protein HU-beta
MNKQEFITYIAYQHKCKKFEAEKIVDLFTSSVIEVLGQDNDIYLAGFGHFSTIKVKERKGNNPITGETIQLKSYNRPRFKSWKKLKDGCNK